MPGEKAGGVTQELIIRVPGTPVAQPRTKAAFVRGHVQVYTPGKAMSWKDTVAYFAQKAVADRGWQKTDRSIGLCVDIDFHFPRPSGSGYRKSSLWKFTKPDRDNLDKAVLDGLTWSGIIHDDAQVVDGRIRKLIDDDWHGAVIRITLADSPELPVGAKSKAMPLAQEALAI